ncbi:MAG: M28 family peptidase [Longimicrobiales bacterium]
MAAAFIAAPPTVPLHAQARRATAPDVIDTLAIRAHTRFLADDLLRGRGTGTEGERLAAAYIESQLIAIGTRGLGPNGAFTMPVPLRTAIILPSSELVLTRGADHEPFTYGGRNFIANTGGGGAFHDFTGPVMYAGAPARALPLLRASSELRGAVIAFDGPLGGDAVGIIPLLIERGASGVLILVNESQMDLYVRSRGDRRFFAAANIADPVWQPDLPVLIVGPGVLPALLRDAPAALRANPLTSLVTWQTRIAVSIRTEMHDVQAANVGAIIRGSDPQRRNDVILYTAHYDHLGISGPDARGDSIYNGFSDNAAGSAMLLAIAKAFKQKPPAHSVAFMFFTGEERGLLGSSYAAANPPFPLSRIKALINLDAGAPPAPPISWRVAGGIEAADLGALAVDVATRAGWTTALSAASPNTDYWPFLHRGVPAVFIVPGNEWENTTTAQRDAIRAKWDRYHQAGDEWAADFPFAGLQRYAAYALAIGRAADRR